MAKVWVLGGEGFIGRAVCRRLSEDGHEVISCSASATRVEKVPSHVRHPRTRVLLIPGYRDLRPDKGDVCVHLAESNLASAPMEGADSSLLGDGKYPDPDDLVRLIESAGFAQVVYASSAAVYGDVSTEARHESETVDPGSPYARRKHANELRFLESGCSAVLRLANTYGPGMSKGNVLSEIIEQAGRGDCVAVNDLAPIRDFVHVEDVARAFSAAISSRANGVFNVSTGSGTSVADLAAIILKIMGRKDLPVTTRSPLIPGRTGTVSARASVLVLSNKRAAEILDWKPRVSLEEGIARMVGGGERS